MFSVLSLSPAYWFLGGSEMSNNIGEPPDIYADVSRRIDIKIFIQPLIFNI